jgi:hypothetical protein
LVKKSEAQRGGWKKNTHHGVKLYMAKRICILSAFLIIFFLSNAQQDLPKEQFCKQFNNCGFDGNNISYIVKLYYDSTIEIQRYAEQCIILNGLFSKTTYFGKYSKSNDTCIISYLAFYAETRDRYTKDILKPGMPMNMMFLKSPTVFFVRNGTISSPYFLFPDLPKASITDVYSIESSFRERGSQLYQNIIEEARKQNQRKKNTHHGVNKKYINQNAFAEQTHENSKSVLSDIFIVKGGVFTSTNHLLPPLISGGILQAEILKNDFQNCIQQYKKYSLDWQIKERLTPINWSATTLVQDNILQTDPDENKFQNWSKNYREYNLGSIKKMNHDKYLLRSRVTILDFRCW